jgi:phosphoglycolate phosphatase
VRLVVFDCDGTLADSQADIVAAMDDAFRALDLPPPGRERTLQIVGLSLPEAMAALAPALPLETRIALAEQYRTAAQTRRLGSAQEPLYAGADALVRALARQPDTVLGLATGKSQRGVERLIAHHGWAGLFATLQTADTNPSKPDPAMLQRAMAETGAEARDTLMIGDTSYDIHMARAAGVMSIGVSWGYHGVADLRAAGASHIVDDFDGLWRLLTA